MDIGSILSGNIPHPTPYTLHPSPQGERGKDDLKTAAQEFESYFIYYMLKVMRESIPKGCLFNGGKGEEIYRSFQDEELAKGIVKSGGIGLTDIIMRDLLHTLKSNGDPADKEIANSAMNNNIGGMYEDK